MKRRSTRVIDEYLALVEKGDQAALIDLVARHPEELGSLSLHTARSTRQDLPARRRVAVLQTVALFAMAFVALILVTANLLPVSVDQPELLIATLVRADGEVYLLTASGSWQPATAGASIQVGDRVRTGPQSVAQLAFPDGSTTGLEAETEIAVARADSWQDGQVRSVVLRQLLGRTYNRIQRSLDQAHHFEIETPAAVTTVRGTEFVVDVESGGTTHVVVIEGVVDVTAQAVTVEVPASYETTVEPAQSPAAAQPASMPFSSQFRLTPAQSAKTETPQALTPTETPQSDEAKATRKPHPEHTPKATHTPKPKPTPQPTHTPKPPKEPQPTKEHKPDREPKP